MNKSFNFSHIDNLWEIWKISYYFFSRTRKHLRKEMKPVRAGVIHMHEHTYAHKYTLPFLSIKD